MRCTCDRDVEGPHHHRFGGTFPCEDPRPCVGCGNVKPVEFRQPPWPEDDDEEPCDP